jgi:hypothetical protein
MTARQASVMTPEERERHYAELAAKRTTCVHEWEWLSGPHLFQCKSCHLTREAIVRA